MTGTATKVVTAVDLPKIPSPPGLRPCPKCGGRDVWMRYCDSCAKRTYRDDCRHGEPEHFHRGCRTCQYEWRTDDVIEPKVVCDR